MSSEITNEPCPWNWAVAKAVEERNTKGMINAECKPI